MHNKFWPSLTSNITTLVNRRKIRKHQIKINYSKRDTIFKNFLASVNITIKVQFCLSGTFEIFYHYFKIYKNSWERDKLAQEHNRTEIFCLSQVPSVYLSILLSVCGSLLWPLNPLMLVICVCTCWRQNYVFPYHLCSLAESGTYLPAPCQYFRENWFSNTPQKHLWRCFADKRPSIRLFVGLKDI